MCECVGPTSNEAKFKFFSPRHLSLPQTSSAKKKENEEKESQNEIGHRMQTNEKETAANMSVVPAAAFHLQLCNHLICAN